MDKVPPGNSTVSRALLSLRASNRESQMKKKTNPTCSLSPKQIETVAPAADPASAATQSTTAEAVFPPEGPNLVPATCACSSIRRPMPVPAAHPCLFFVGNRCVLRRQRVVASHLVPCCSSLVVGACLPLHLVPCGPFYSSPACRQDWGCDMGNGKFSLCRLTQIQSVTTPMSSSTPFDYSYRCRWSLSISLLWVASYLDSWDMDL